MNERLSFRYMQSHGAHAASLLGATASRAQEGCSSCCPVCGRSLLERFRDHADMTMTRTAGRGTAIGRQHGPQYSNDYLLPNLLRLPRRLQRRPSWASGPYDGFQGQDSKRRYECKGNLPVPSTRLYSSLESVSPQCKRWERRTSIAVITTLVLVMWRSLTSGSVVEGARTAFRTHTIGGTREPARVSAPHLPRGRSPMLHQDDPSCLVSRAGAVPARSIRRAKH
jgi:hypothetical protein